MATPPQRDRTTLLLHYDRKTGQMRKGLFAGFPEIVKGWTCYANDAKTDDRCTYLWGNENVYARSLLEGRGTFAIPSAGFPITYPMLAKLEMKYLQLFTPEKRDIEYPDMIANDRTWLEYYSIQDPPEKPVIAIGTTVVKALETYAINRKREGLSNLLIKPGHPFKLVGGLMTSLHYPNGPHSLATEAFVGSEACREIYDYAICEKMKFVEFGDRILIL